jgi:hypothetical protein
MVGSGVRGGGVEGVKGVLIRTKVLFDMDQGIWAGLNPFEHSMHPALGLNLSSSTIDVLVEVHGVLHSLNTGPHPR